MKAFAALLLALTFALPGAAQTAAPTLDSVLSEMDRAAADFKTAQADFVWDQFSKVVNETDTQKGVIYFRRGGGTIEMAADIAEPVKKTVLYTGKNFQIYQPSIDQITQYDTSKNKGEVESFLVLGFGSRGHDLAKQYDVKLGGPETVAGIRTVRLELVPRSEKTKSMVTRILLWIDSARGVSVQQQFFEPSGDYRLVKYSNVKLNQNVPGDAFKLHTTGKTKVVTPQT